MALSDTGQNLLARTAFFLPSSRSPWTNTLRFAAAALSLVRVRPGITSGSPVHSGKGHLLMTAGC